MNKVFNLIFLLACAREVLMYEAVHAHFEQKNELAITQTDYSQIYYALTDVHTHLHQHLKQIAKHAHGENKLEVELMISHIESEIIHRAGMLKHQLMDMFYLTPEMIYNIHASEIKDMMIRIPAVNEHRTAKRGLNFLSTAFKFLTGAPDHQDLERINGAINFLEKGHKKQLHLNEITLKTLQHHTAALNQSMAQMTKNMRKIDELKNANDILKVVMVQISHAKEIINECQAQIQIIRSIISDGKNNYLNSACIKVGDLKTILKEIDDKNPELDLIYGLEQIHKYYRIPITNIAQNGFSILTIVKVPLFRKSEVFNMTHIMSQFYSGTIAINSKYEKLRIMNGEILDKCIDDKTEMYCTARGVDIAIIKPKTCKNEYCFYAETLKHVQAYPITNEKIAYSVPNNLTIHKICTLDDKKIAIPPME